ncbi:GNAT family N-acetyltransferase [Vagococcus sp.]|uniref:GNAT family N-acetyltransferase n=1 Tax=Vagococcus sp. TaxID=1933889 RepID=UPI003F98638E
MIRPAQPEDAFKAMELVMIVLKDMELDVFDKLSEQQLKNLLAEAFQDLPDYRYGYRNAIVKELDNDIAGIAFGYPDHLEKHIDSPYIDFLYSRNLSDEYRLFNELETFKDEWYLDTIVTSPHFRRRGVASDLLDSLPILAKQHDRQIIGLNVDQVNKGAQKVYLNNGFGKVGEIEIAGHQYDHLQKKFAI